MKHRKKLIILHGVRARETVNGDSRSVLILLHSTEQMSVSIMYVGIDWKTKLGTFFNPTYDDDGPYVN